MRKLAVITGGTKGIGKALILKFAKEGFDIITCARNGEALQALQLEVQGKFKVDLVAVTADLSRREETRRFADAVLALKRPIDVLVNNAGFFLPGMVTAEAPGTLEQMIEGNVYSAYYTTRGLIESIKQQGHGHIFNMCSIASIVAYPDGGSYTVSKFALLGYTKVLRQELLHDGIRVTAVLPGATLTPSWAGTDLPEERFMKAEDVAEAVFGAFSLSPRSVVEEILIRPQKGDL